MTSQTAPNPKQLFTVLLAGALVLLVVHTLGRFIYTPLLPYLVADGQFSAADGAAVATWNYLGYLMGAMVAIKWHRIDQIRFMLPLFLVVHVITTLVMTQTDNLTVISAGRWLNGVANGVVFVQAPALILEWLVLRNRATMSGLVYIGVGAGLLVSSGLVTGTADWLEGAERWWPAALLSIPLAWWGVMQLRKLHIPVREHDESGKAVVNTPLIDRASAPLFLSYAGAGLGYILPMTFLPLLAKLELPDGHALLDGTWVIVALFTIPAPWLWNKLGARLGDLAALKLNFLIQLLGVLAAVLWPGAIGLVLCAALVGGTFLGTVLLTQRLGRALHPHQGPRLSAAMVALYGFTQMVGPWLTKQWLDAGGTLVSAFGIGVAALAFGLLLAFFVPKPEDWHARSK
ncbi:YbfB/YjiJ family MFS transporter [Marinobacter persicus]|uniref:MFS family arabinose efflux permease n=1 Tax=Marinobacter persicus TaxID=930118 RepID=A0A2S6G5F6_9GAMM|nr:YbfB/YjiJ family MFS transporter [Marinobacter persicus]PPK51086.1 putative MFS family arabinose efflux permease [Marinobacter persicus]PPK54364.1 putative MFS family arabinose efflux permease [Marinobacter persicus]PPK57688.1 putative MFS family arabinose efflux permease [Marinobacter persicus]